MPSALRGSKPDSPSYLRASSAAFGVSSTRLDGVSLQPPSEQHAIFPLSAVTTAPLAVVDVWTVFFSEQQGLASLAVFWTLEVLASPAWTAKANATNMEARRSFFISGRLTSPAWKGN